jgi:DNA-binding transcriptional LysR family regulator
MKIKLLCDDTKGNLVKVSFLATLETVLRLGSFAAAAEEIGLTASAVGLQMRQLENYFGQPLFDRSGRTAQPNALAQEVADAMRGALVTMESLKARHSPSLSGRMNLGTVRSVQTTTLPATLRDIRRRHPQLDIRLFADDSAALLERLRAGLLDAAVLVRPQSGGSSRLFWRNLATEPFVLLAPLDATHSSPADLLNRYEWIRFNASLTGGRIAANYARSIAPRARSTLEVGSIEGIIAMVAAGLGVSVVPKLREPLFSIFAVREIPLGRQAPSRQIAFVCRGADRDTRRIIAVCDAFERRYANEPAGGHNSVRRSNAGRQK